VDDATGELLEVKISMARARAERPEQPEGRAARAGLARSPFALLSDDELRLVLHAVGDDHAWLLALAHPVFFGILREAARPRQVGRRFVHFRTPVSAAVASVSLLRWATVDGCGLRPALACAHAAACGQLEVLRYAREQVGALCQWDSWTTASAALGGHAPVLEYAVKATQNTHTHARTHAHTHTPHKTDGARLPRFTDGGRRSCGRGSRPHPALAYGAGPHG